MASRNVKVIALSDLLNDISVSGQGPLLPIFYLALGATPFQYGLIEGMATIVGTVAGAPGGELADRLGRKRPMTIGYALMFVARIAVGAVSSLTTLFVARAFARFGRYLRYPGRDSLLAESVDPSERSMAFAIYQFADNLGSAIGPVVTVLVLAYVGQALASLRLGFVFTALPAGASAVLLVLFVRETLGARGKGAQKKVVDGGADYVARLRSVVGDRNIRAFIVILGAFNTIAVSADFLVIYSSRGPLGTGPIGSTELYLAWALTSVVAALPAGRVIARLGKRAGVALSLAFYILSMLLTVFSRANFAVLGLAFSALGVYDAIFPTAWRSFMADSVTSSSSRGLAMSTFNTLSGVTNDAVAPAIAGLLFTDVAASAPFLLGIALTLPLSVAFLLFVREPDVQRRDPSEEEQTNL